MNLKYDEETIVNLSHYFNLDLMALAPIRQKQDSKFVDIIREKAEKKMNGFPKLSDPKVFYIGSIDFMVMESGGQNEFVILESNGGSSRGLLSLSYDQVEIIFDAYKKAIDECAKDTPKRVLIGRMPIDDLYQEKIMLMEFLKQKYESEGFSVGIYTTRSYNPLQQKEPDIILIVSDYNTLLKDIAYHDQQIFFRDKAIHLLIGDGIARRFPIVADDIKKNWNNVKTNIVNRIYHVTDDKFNTYLAEHLGRDILSKYHIHFLKFGKVFTRDHLETSLKNLISIQKDFIIKPFGGSGGAGILPILQNTSKEQISGIIDKSIAEFHHKFDPTRNPFPYTIQEMAKFLLIDWKESQRTFDLRIYVAQQNGYIIPIGGEARIARAPFTGEYAKNEFVVNICGDWGENSNAL